MTSRMSMMTSRYRYNRKNPFPNIKENNSLVNQPNKVQIFDKNGNDVTPLPMINPNKNAGKPQKTGSTSSQSDVSLSSLTKVNKKKRKENLTYIIIYTFYLFIIIIIFYIINTLY